MRLAEGNHSVVITRRATAGVGAGVELGLAALDPQEDPATCDPSRPPWTLASYMAAQRRLQESPDPRAMTTVAGRGVPRHRIESASLLVRYWEPGDEPAEMLLQQLMTMCVAASTVGVVVDDATAYVGLRLEEWAVPQGDVYGRGYTVCMRAQNPSSARLVSYYPVALHAWAIWSVVQAQELSDRPRRAADTPPPPDVLDIRVGDDTERIVLTDPWRAQWAPPPMTA